MLRVVNDAIYRVSTSLYRHGNLRTVRIIEVEHHDTPVFSRKSNPAFLAGSITGFKPF